MRHGWHLSCVWIAPAYRRKGVLSKRWPWFVLQYGWFTVEHPLSEAMEAFLFKVHHRTGLESPRKRESLMRLQRAPPKKPYLDRARLIKTRLRPSWEADFRLRSAKRVFSPSLLSFFKAGHEQLSLCRAWTPRRKHARAPAAGKRCSAVVYVPPVTSTHGGIRASLTCGHTNGW